MKESNKKLSRLVMAGIISLSLLAPVALASSNIVNTTLGTQITVNAKRIHHHKHARHHTHRHVRRHIRKHEHKRRHNHRRKIHHHSHRRVRHHHIR